MYVKWFMKCFIYWTVDFKSSKPQSLQLWMQFKQLRREAWKSQDFNGDVELIGAAQTSIASFFPFLKKIMLLSFSSCSLPSFCSSSSSLNTCLLFQKILTRGPIVKFLESGWQRLKLIDLRNLTQLTVDGRSYKLYNYNLFKFHVILNLAGYVNTPLTPLFCVNHSLIQLVTTSLNHCYCITLILHEFHLHCS